MPVDVPNNSHEAAEQLRRVLKRPGRFFRRFRRAVRVGFVLLCLMPLGLVIVTQGPVPRYLLKRAIERQSGGVFSSEWVSLKLDGSVIIDKPSLSVASIAGDAARLFEAESVVIDLDWSAWAAGVVVPADVRVIGPTARLSIDEKDSKVNLSGLSPAVSGTSGGAGLRVPRITIERGRLIFGQHKDGAFEHLVELTTRGWVSPMPGGERFMVRLRAEDVVGGNLPIDLNGEIDLGRGEGVIDAGSLQLARWGPDRMPSVGRALWESLRLRGQIEKTQVRFSREIGLQTTLKLRDVSLNVPVAAGRAEITGSRNPRMDGVTGTLRLTTAGAGAGIEADLAGSFEDLPAQVRLVTQGLDLTSAYQATITAEKFRLEKDPRVLWFTPEIVQTNFERFSGPTALVDARIEIARGRPNSATESGETSIKGTLIFREGAATFSQFPYPISNLEGQVTFDDDKVRIVGIRGNGPSGAKFFAEGEVSPPTADAKLDINVVCTDVPMDEPLLTAIKRSKGSELAEGLFSRVAYDRLIGQGLIISTVAKRQYERELGEIEAALAGGGEINADSLARRDDLKRRLAAPLVDFSGMIDSITVKVVSDFGFESPSRQEIRVRFKDSMILTKFFPLPVRAKQMALRITDDVAEIIGQDMTGAGGGTIDMQARIDIRRVPGTGEWTYDPSVTASARGVPISPLLIQAIPQKTDPDTTDVRGLLTAMRLGGSVDATIALTTPPAGRTSTRVDLTLADVSSQPNESGSGIGAKLESVGGSITVTDDRLLIHRASGLLVPSKEIKTGLGPPVPGAVEISGDWSIAREGTARPGSLDVSVVRCDTELAIEDIIRPLAPGGSASITALRERFQPDGRVDVRVRVTQGQDAAGENPALPLRLRAELANARNLSIVAEDQRVDLLQDRGTITVDTSAGDEPTIVSLKDIRTSLTLNARPIGRVEIAGGKFTIARDATDERPEQPMRIIEPVSILLRDARFDSAAVKDQLRRYAPAAVLAEYEKLQPVGNFDAEMTMRAREDQSTQLSIALRPIDLAFTLDSKRYTFETLSGEITLDDTSASAATGRITTLTAVGNDWQMMGTGTWALGGEDPSLPAWQVAADLDIETRGLPSDLLAILPEAVPAGITENAITLGGDADARGLKLRVAKPRATESEIASGIDPALVWSLQGRAAFDRLSLSRGINVVNMIGGVEGSLASTPSGVSADAVLTGTRARVEGLLLTSLNGKLSFRSPAPGATPPDGTIPPTLVVRDLAASAYGGRLTVDGELLPADAQGSRGFEAHLAMVDVRFADVMVELSRRGRAITGPPVPDTFEPGGVLTPDRSRGLLNLDVSVRGDTDNPLTIGRGTARVAGGSALVDLPVLTRLMQLSNLRLPSSAPFDYAAAEFHVSQSVVQLDQAVVLSRDLAMVGAGAIRLPGGELDIALNSRSRRRMFLVSDLIEVLRDELVTATVGGTLSEPTYAVSPLSGTRRLIAALFGARGGGPSIPKVEMSRYEADREAAEEAKRTAAGR